MKKVRTENKMDQNRETFLIMDRWLAGLALTGIAIMTLGMGGFKSLQNIGMGLVVISSIFSLPKIGYRLYRDPLTILVLFFFLYLFVRTLFAHFETPEWSVDHWDRARRMSRIILLPLIAFWLANNRRMLELLFAIFAIGVSLAVFQGLWEAGDVRFIFEDKRIRFNLNPQRMGYSVGLVLAGLFIYRKPLLEWLGYYISSVGAWGIWVFCVGIFFQSFLVSQARGAMLSMTVVALVCLAGWVYFLLTGAGRVTKIKSAAIMSALLIALLIMVGLQSENISKRFVNEKDVISQLVSGEIDKMRFSSVSARYYLWNAGLAAWFQKPIFGWGTDGSREVILNASGPEELQRFNHFHNTYIDVLVRFGLFGFFLLSAISYYLVKGAWKAYTHGAIDRRCGLIFGIGFLLFMLVNITETHMVPSWGWFMLVLLGGGMYSQTILMDDLFKGSTDGRFPGFDL